MSLLELAIGWLVGVQILLEFGADAAEVELRRSSYRPCDTEDTDCDDYCDSVMPLIQAGCWLRTQDILLCRSRKVRSMFIRDLASRRKRLQALAQACLSPQRLAEILGPENDDRVMDAHARQIYAELLAQGWKVDHSLRVSEWDNQSVFAVSYEYKHIDTWDELYQSGFRDIDTPNAKGLTPLMAHLNDTLDHPRSLHQSLQRIVWLIDRGASLDKRMPWANGTVAHMASSWTVCVSLHAISNDDHRGSNQWPKFEAQIIAYKDTIFLVPSVRDHCLCACCPGGCTTFSVALRAAIERLRGFVFTREGAMLFHGVFRPLLQWTDNRAGTEHIIIRSLTFHALGLRHTCCTETDEPNWLLFGDYLDFKDEEEVEQIWGEDQSLYCQLERLVSEFENKFSQLGLPIMEFLDRYWHGRMIEYLSTPSASYDEQHIQQTRNLGISLEPHEVDIPDVVYYFGDLFEDITFYEDFADEEFLSEEDLTGEEDVTSE